jgi:hypothetical protein
MSVIECERDEPSVCERMLLEQCVTQRERRKERKREREREKREKERKGEREKERKSEIEKLLVQMCSMQDVKQNHHVVIGQSISQRNSKKNWN